MLAPWDPPRVFVVLGPYQFVPDPVISGVISAFPIPLLPAVPLQECHFPFRDSCGTVSGDETSLAPSPIPRLSAQEQEVWHRSLLHIEDEGRVKEANPKARRERAFA